MPEITYKEVEGKVQAVHDRDSKDWFGICIDDVWYNGDDSTEIQKGDMVKLVVKEREDSNRIKGVKIIRDDGQNSTRSEQVRSNSAGGAASNPLTKDQSINLKVAHKSAVRQLDRRQTKDEKDYKEMLTKLTKLHLESLEEVQEWMQE